MPKVFAYIRVSTTRQGEKGVSLTEQRSAIIRFASEHNLDIILWFEEQQTAAKRGRPQFSQMVKLLRQGKAAGVVIHKIDRSARNLRDWADLGELIDAGVKVHFANDNLDLSSRGGRLSADIQAVVAADFVRNNREEVKKGLNGRLKQGLWPFAAPIGYLNRGKGQPKAVDPKAAALVLQTFQLYSSGKFTVQTLLDEMTRRGFRNRNGKPFSMDGMCIILRNSFYTGLLRTRRTGESYQGIHEPIVPPRLFSQVQAVLDGRTYTHLQVHDYLFRRRFQCQTCGRSLIGSRQKGHIYYRCHNKRCPSTCLREEQLDQAVRESLRKITFPIELRAALHVALRKRRGNLKAVQDAERASLRAAVDQAKGRLDRLTDLFLDGSLEKDLFMDRKEHLLMELAQRKEAAAETEREPETRLREADQMLQLAESAILLYEMESAAEKRDLLDRTCSNRTAGGKNVEITLRPPFDRLANLALQRRRWVDSLRGPTSQAAFGDSSAALRPCG